ncbi:hypothetical protein TNCT_58821 [Trichonephila clavata]|uniref:Uncharacterized protein n=1 Tax=Trichonephila clavata TaxID=2740835 RepID=A0A8X6JCA4_TRICU|nr:hypothetical protein TNCT_58821 [Trichonephila clavata]
MSGDNGAQRHNGAVATSTHRYGASSYRPLLFNPVAACNCTRCGDLCVWRVGLAAPAYHRCPATSIFAFCGSDLRCWSLVRCHRGACQQCCSNMTYSVSVPTAGIRAFA